MTDLWRCTVCGQVSTVGRCCGEETREPWRPIRRKDEEETRRIEAVADRAEQLEAEIERLRAEVERLRADRDSWEQQASDRVADWYAEHLRAERLAEALRVAREYVVSELAAERDKFAGYEHCSNIASIEADLVKIDAALAKENSND